MSGTRHTRSGDTGSGESTSSGKMLGVGRGRCPPVGSLPGQYGLHKAGLGLLKDPFHFLVQ